jgi:hypothetical protein
MHSKMKNIFEEEVVTKYSELTEILVKKEKESLNGNTGCCVVEGGQVDITTTSTVAVPSKNKWFKFIFGGFITAVGAGTVFFFLRNKKYI